MNHPSNNHEPQVPSAAAATGVDAQSMAEDQAGATRKARRRFLGKGAAAAPAILTLAAQPALGVTCYSPSGSLSKNTSGGRNYVGNCTGVSPGNYKTQTGGSANHWPAGWLSTDPISKMYTPVPAYCQKSGVDKTLNQILSLGGNVDPNKFAFHMIGAYLNVLNNYIPPNVLDTAKLRQIWSDIHTLGYYTVGGIQRDRAWIVDQYLKPYGIAP